MTKEKFEELKAKIPIGYYEGLYPSMKDGYMIIDDANHHEVEEILRKVKPDIYFSGVRDKYISHKMGVPSKQLHSYDYTGPYAGFTGAMNFARDVANMLTTPAWKLVTAPWEGPRKEG
jgi:nitrogenase molybdenum-iron protein alpha chain